MTYSLPLKILLVLIGTAIMALGLNIGLGGILTLGWQISEPFLTVTNDAIYHVQDSHIRFIGGIWFCVGAVFFFGAFFSAPLRNTLAILCIAIACAGVFRFSGLEGGAVLSTDILPSLALELVLFPLLAVWLFRSTSTVA